MRLARPTQTASTYRFMGMNRILLVLGDYIEEQKRLAIARAEDEKRIAALRVEEEKRQRALEVKREQESWAKMSDMTDFLGWPFQRVKYMKCRQVTRRNMFLWEYDKVTRKSTKVPMKGRSTINVPVEFALHTDTHDFYLLYRDADWYWHLSWSVPFDSDQEPLNVRHRWVRTLRAGAIRTGVYVPHPEERDFPKTWDEYHVPDEIERMGERRRGHGLYPGLERERYR